MSERVEKTEAQGSRRPPIVLVVSIALTFLFGIWGLLQPESMTGSAMHVVDYVLHQLGWLYLLFCTGFLFLAGFLAFGRYGHLRLGKDDERPEFSTASWLAMLFAAGMGCGLLFWGVAEPIYHFASPPGGVEARTPEAARLAMVLANLHWGLHAWSIYAVCALVLAYFMFRRQQPGMISAPIRATMEPSLGRELLAESADVIAVLAVIFGLAGSLAMGTMQVRAGLHEVYGLPLTTGASLGILLLLTICYLASASTGLSKGIQYLSNLNMILVLALLVFIVVLGPTAYVMESFVNTFGDYFSSLFTYSFKVLSYEGEMDWTSSWTLTYLIWWVAWGPFVGIFIARISRGRTIREFCLGVILIPTIFSMFWFSALGGSAIWIELVGGGGIADLVFEDLTTALFAFLNFFPGGGVANFIGIVLIFVFLVTSADSGTFVIGMMTSRGELNPKIGLKLAWGVLIAVLTVAILVTGSIEVGKAMAIFGALPFTLVVGLQIVCFLRAIRNDRGVASRGRPS